MLFVVLTPDSIMIETGGEPIGCSSFRLMKRLEISFSHRTSGADLGVWVRIFVTGPDNSVRNKQKIYSKVSGKRVRVRSRVMNKIHHHLSGEMLRASTCSAGVTV